MVETKLQVAGDVGATDDDDLAELYTTGVMDEEKVKVVAEDEEDEEAEEQVQFDRSNENDGSDGSAGGGGREESLEQGEASKNAGEGKALRRNTLVRRESFLRANRNSLRKSRRRLSRVSIQGMASA